jgi:sugar lactone lactonase YvrE
MKKPLIYAVFSACFFSACIKSSIPIPPPVGTSSSGTLTISSISPVHGAGGTTITVYGTGFSGISANDVVTINGKSAQVISASADSLVVTIPVQAGTGAVSLSIGNRSVTGPILTYDVVYMVSTLAGGAKGFADGTGSGAQFYQPSGICVDAGGNLYVSDAANYKIREVTPAGVVSTIAGSTKGFQDGSALTAQFDQPFGICVNAQGTLYIADYWAHAIRQYTAAGGVTTITGGTMGYVNASVATAEFNNPAGICTDATGAIYVADAGNSIIRGIYGGYTYLIAGDPCYSGTTDGTGMGAFFSDPYGLCTDGNGTFYVADTYTQTIRKVTSGGVVTTIAGRALREGTQDGPGDKATFFQPSAICVDANGNLYVADTQNHLIRMVTPDGVVSTIAGTANPGHADGIGTAASFNQPFGICINAQGVIYVADTYNNTIRKIVQQ